MQTTIRLDVTGSLPLWNNFKEGKGMRFGDRLEFSLSALQASGEKYDYWCIPFSGGKDSGAVVSLVAHAIRHNLVKPPKKLLVLRSDTGQELFDLDMIANGFLSRLRDDGFDARSVEPETKHKFYVQVLGKGLLPVARGMKGRWCTRSLKVDPMKRAMDAIYKETGEKFLLLSGVRMGESAARDIKLTASSDKAADIHFPACSAESGECGAGGIWMDKSLATCYDAVPIIVHWSTCMVFDWLQGWMELGGNLGHDYTEHTRKIASLYGQEADGRLEGAARYGCIGCSAVSKDKMMVSASRKDPSLTPLLELQYIWTEMREARHRLWNIRNKKKGCLTIEARRYFYQRIKAIHDKAGVELIPEEDRRLIFQMWEDRVYPRGYTGMEPTADTVQNYEGCALQTTTEEME